MTTLGETRRNNALIEQTSLWAVSALYWPVQIGWRTEPLNGCSAGTKFRSTDYCHDQPTSRCRPSASCLGRRPLLASVHLRSPADVSPGHSQHRQEQSSGSWPSSQQRQPQAAIETGRKPIEIKSHLRHGVWLPWVQRQSGLNYRTLQRYMRMAAEEERSASRRGRAESLVDSSCETSIGCASFAPVSPTTSR